MNELDTNQKPRRKAKRNSTSKCKTNQGVEEFQFLYTIISKSLIQKDVAQLCKSVFFGSIAVM